MLDKERSSSHHHRRRHREHGLVLEAILALPEMVEGGKKLVHLSIVGSRSKGISSLDSDYDVKAVILHSRADYLLQKITPSKSFKTHINIVTVDDDDHDHDDHGPTVEQQQDDAKTTTTRNLTRHHHEVVEVEGTLVDYLTMQKYCLQTNPAAYDALFSGLVLRETAASRHLRALFCKAYNPSKLLMSYFGLMHHEKKTALKQNRQFQIKHIANMVYYSTMIHQLLLQQLRCCCSSSGSNDDDKVCVQEPPSQNAFELLEGLLIPGDHGGGDALKRKIRVLYQERIEDKTKTVTTDDVSSIDEPLLRDFIETTMQQMPPQKNITRPPKGNSNVTDALQLLQKAAEVTFVNLISNDGQGNIRSTNS